MRKVYGRTTIFLGVLGLVACSAAASSDGESVGTTGQAVTGTCATTPVVGQSLFLSQNVTTYPNGSPVNTPNPFGAAVLADPSFSFLNTMEQIVTTGGVDVAGKGGAEAAALALYQQMIGTLNAPTCTGTVNGFPVDCPSEGKIATTNPFTGTGGKDIVVPVAVVNRFDLAPSDGSNCGEYRIVYAIQPSDIEFAQRFLLIFEATLPNPTPEKGLKACLPVAQLWDSLSAPGISTTTVVDTLQKFYFKGFTANGVTFAPVVQASNYGFGFPNNANTGQIRLNMLSEQLDWELRQFELSQACPDGGGGCTVTAANTSVTNNPFGGLFRTGGGSDPTFEAQFPSQVAALAKGTIPGISMITPQQDNGGESDESGSPTQFQNYLSAASGNTALLDNIQTALTKISSKLTPTDILNRATTQSCAGCHELSAGTSLGGKLTWPASNGFVQVEESNGQQSIALANFFLPFRAQVLTSFIDKHCSDAGDDEVVPGQTVSGNDVGGAN